MGVFLPSLWEFRPMDNIPTIMNYELCITNYKGSPSTLGETKKKRRHNTTSLHTEYFNNIIILPHNH